MIKKAIKHFILITKHRMLVLKLAIKAGIPYRGIVHDLSKYSPTEFIESVKFYNGKHSPITDAKAQNGYSLAWLHHKGRNKHHFEYWYDSKAQIPSPMIPYKYIVEMICDNLAAGMIYEGKNWNNESQLKYWNKVKGFEPGNQKVKNMLTEVFTQVSINGVNKTIKRKNLKKLYKEYCEE